MEEKGKLVRTRTEKNIFHIYLECSLHYHFCYFFFSSLQKIFFLLIISYHVNDFQDFFFVKFVYMFIAIYIFNNNISLYNLFMA